MRNNANGLKTARLAVTWWLNYGKNISTAVHSRSIQCKFGMCFAMLFCTKKNQLFQHQKQTNPFWIHRFVIDGRCVLNCQTFGEISLLMINGCWKRLILLTISLIWIVLLIMNGLHAAYFELAIIFATFLFGHHRILLACINFLSY